MKYLIEPMMYNANSDCEFCVGKCEEDFCFIDVPCSEQCQGYCGEFDPCPGYLCGGYSTRSFDK